MEARGGRALAWLAGYGTSSDAVDMLSPDVTGAARAIALALADAGLPVEAIGYVNAHGTGTVANDINEAQALREVFGDALDAIPVSSTKPIVGHALGAAGALELAITVAALQAQIVPPQINCITPDPRCPLDLPLDGARPHAFEAALSNSFAFGGINAALVVCRAD
jgi:nodulation protein E